MGLKIDEFLIGMLVFSVIVFSATLILSDIDDSYSTDTSVDQLNNTYNVVQSMYNITDESRQNIIEAELGAATEESSTLTVLNKGVQEAYNTFRLAGQTFRLIGAMIQDLIDFVGLPSGLGTFAILGVSLFVILSIAFLILRVRS